MFQGNEAGANFPTIASVSLSSYFSTFEKYIKFNDYLYNICDNNNNNAYNKKELMDLMFNNQSDKKHKIYCIDSLFYMLFTRPKKAELFKNMFKDVVSELKEQNNTCFSDILDSLNYDQTFIKDILFSLGISTEKPKDFYRRENSLLALFPEDSIESTLIEDNVQKLKEILLTDSDFDINQKVKVRTFAVLPSLERKNPVMTQETSLSTSQKNAKEINLSVSLLDFCAFYGSNECFKFLQSNGCHFDNNITQFCVAGGNFSIIRNVEQCGFSFDGCFRTSVQFHRREISEWLLSEYECEEFVFTECLKFYDYRTFLFMLHNGADPNMEHNNQSALYIACQHENTDAEAIRLFIDGVDDVNRGLCSFLSLSPLYALCSRNECDIDTIKLLIDKGADVNEGEKNNRGTTIHTPLYALCKNKNVDVNALKLLIDNGANIEIGNQSPLFAMCASNPKLEAMRVLLDKGANVNITDKRYSITTTPLCDLCSNNADIEVIKLLIEKGADVNKGDLSPLYYLCRNKDINIDAISFLIEKGADINQKCKDFTGNISTPLLYLSHHPNTNKSSDINNIIKRAQMMASACAN